MEKLEVSFVMKLLDVKTVCLQFTAFCLMLVFTSNCNTRNSELANPVNVSYNLIKSFVTADTTLFYDCIIADSVAHFLNEYSEESLQIQGNMVHEVYFHHYAPWTISTEYLASPKRADLVLYHFEIDVLKKGEAGIEARLKWSKDRHSKMDSLRIFMVQESNGVWKVKNIRRH